MKTVVSAFTLVLMASPAYAQLHLDRVYRPDTPTVSDVLKTRTDYLETGEFIDRTPEQSHLNLMETMCKRLTRGVYSIPGESIRLHGVLTGLGLGYDEALDYTSAVMEIQLETCDNVYS